MSEIQFETTQFEEIKQHIYINKNLIYKEKDGTIIINFGDNDRVIDEEAEDFYMFRFTPFSWVYYMMEEKVFSFMSPNSWKDPFERLFYIKNTSIHSNYVNGCVCMNYVGHRGEETSWKSYQDFEPIVKIEYNFKELISQLSILLDAKCNKENCNISIYIDIVKYWYDRKEIVQLYKNKCAYSKTPDLPGFTSLADYLTCMTLKRKAFVNEHEIRFFLVSDKKDLDIEIYDFDIKRCVKRIALPPLRPSYHTDNRNKYYHALQDVFNEGMKNYFAGKIGSITQSRLYDVDSEL